MSYLQKLSALQAKSQDAKRQTALYQESVKNDAFTTAEAKKDDYLGALSRHLEDATTKLGTIAGLSATTSSIAKHAKKIRSLVKKAPEGARTDVQPRPAPDASAEADTSARSAPAEPPVEEFPFPEVELQRRLGAGAEPEPATSAPERVTGADAQPATPASEEPPATEASAQGESRTIQSVEQRRPTGAPDEDIFQPTAGQPVRRETGARTMTADEGRDLQRVDPVRNISTQSEVPTREQAVAPESTRSAPAPEGGGGGGGAVADLEEGAGNLLERSAPEMATSIVGDLGLSAIPVIGELATAGSLIGTLVSSITGHQAEKKAEESMPTPSSRGTAVASTGFDGEALQHSAE
jgi:hypothetical protein